MKTAAEPPTSQSQITGSAQSYGVNAAIETVRIKEILLARKFAALLTQALRQNPLTNSKNGQ